MCQTTEEIRHSRRTRKFISQASSFEATTLQFRAFYFKVKSLGNTTDEIYLSATVRDVNDFFEQEMTFLSDYHNNLKEATQRADKMTSKHKGCHCVFFFFCMHIFRKTEQSYFFRLSEVADSYIKLSSCILHLATLEQPPMERFLTKVSETFEKCRVINFDSAFILYSGELNVFFFFQKIEGRVATDQDLKLADTFRYYQRDSHAAKCLLVRRLR